VTQLVIDRQRRLVFLFGRRHRHLASALDPALPEADILKCQIHLITAANQLKWTRAE
jgi:hypothetical protein